MTRRGIFRAGQEGGLPQACLWHDADAGGIGKPADAAGAEEHRRGAPQPFADRL
jgi:hypothetical protein